MKRLTAFEGQVIMNCGDCGAEWRADKQCRIDGKIVKCPWCDSPHIVELKG